MHDERFLQYLESAYHETHHHKARIALLTAVQYWAEAELKRVHRQNLRSQANRRTRMELMQDRPVEPDLI